MSAVSDDRGGVCICLQMQFYLVTYTLLCFHVKDFKYSMLYICYNKLSVIVANGKIHEKVLL